jgi:hypothetical protein
MVPYVAVAALFLILPLVRFGILPLRSGLRARRARRGGCSICGYNLTGNISGVCPECGMPSTTAG